MPPLKASRFPRAFMAYDLVEKRFYMPEEVISIGLTLTGDGLPYWIKEPRNVVICWYSQQFDSKKVPLFEGDIVRMEVQTEFGSLIKDILGVMRWNERNSQFILIMAGNDPHTVYQTLKVERIGHEFTHPELLAKIENTNVNG